MFFVTSGKLHKIPQVKYNLDPICGRVDDTGDLTRPAKINKMNFKIQNIFKK